MRSTVASGSAVSIFSTTLRLLAAPSIQRLKADNAAYFPVLGGNMEISSTSPSTVKILSFKSANDSLCSFLLLFP
jgi:hypothetical protein